jgi:uncharacterized membrane protein YbhN (UPF0104 family)
VHVAWAVLIGWVVVQVSTSSWRWLVLVHPALTIFAVAATANHFWLDGIAAVALLAACAGLQSAVGTLWRSRRASLADPLQLSSAPIARILR